MSKPSRRGRDCPEVSFQPVDEPKALSFINQYTELGSSNIEPIVMSEIIVPGKNNDLQYFSATTVEKQVAVIELNKYCDEPIEVFGSEDYQVKVFLSEDVMKGEKFTIDKDIVICILIKFVQFSRSVVNANVLWIVDEEDNAKAIITGAGFKYKNQRETGGLLNSFYYRKVF